MCLAIVILFSIYAVVSDEFLLRFISPNIKGLQTIGFFQNADGEVVRKTRTDSLWFRVSKAHSIYGGDGVVTSSNSTTTLNIHDDIELILSADSYVRIRELDGKPLIRLSSGEMKIKSSEDQSVLLKQGSKIEEVKLKKGENIISESRGGVQQTKDITENNRDEEVVKPQLENEQPSIVPPEKAMVADLIANFDLPSPKDQTLFLVQSKFEILVSAEAVCPNSCVIRIIKEGKVFREQRFQKNEMAYVLLTNETCKIGAYEWNYENEFTQSRGQFSIEKFEESKFAQAVREQRPVEIK